MSPECACQFEVVSGGCLLEIDVVCAVKLRKQTDVMISTDTNVLKSWCEHEKLLEIEHSCKECTKTRVNHRACGGRSKLISLQQSRRESRNQNIAPLSNFQTHILRSQKCNHRLLVATKLSGKYH